MSVIKTPTEEETRELVQLAELVSELDLTNRSHDYAKKKAREILTKLGFPQEV